MKQKDWAGFEKFTKEHGCPLTTEDITSAAYLVNIGPDFDLKRCAGLYKLGKTEGMVEWTLQISALTGSIKSK